MNNEGLQRPEITYPCSWEYRIIGLSDHLVPGAGNTSRFNWNSSWGMRLTGTVSHGTSSTTPLSGWCS